MAHGVKAVFPLDNVEATYLLPLLNALALTEDLVVYHAQQLQKFPEDLLDMSARVLKSRKQSVAKFVKCFSSTIQDYDFQVGSLVLFCSSHIKKELNHKTKPHFLGTMVIVHWKKGGTYILAKLNGAETSICHFSSHPLPGEAHRSCPSYLIDG